MNGTTTIVVVPFTSRRSRQGDWMLWVGSVTACFLAAMLLIYYFGRRSASKLSQDDALAHLAVLELPTQATSGSPTESDVTA